jgi:hypothetical protein
MPFVATEHRCDAKGGNIMRRKSTVAIVISAVCLGIAVYMPVLEGQGQQKDNPGESEIQRGFDIAPVPLDLTGLTRNLVGLGSYYVNGPSDCIGCHSGPNGYMSGGNVFGPVLSRNLTPDRFGLPGGLTFAQFEQVIRLGTDFKNLAPTPPGNQLIVMPWPAYRHGTDRYVQALYEYLSAIPCIEGGPGIPANRC